MPTVKSATLDNKRGDSRKLISKLIRLQEHERKRISRELHDDIGQRISLVTSEVAMLANQYSRSAPPLSDRLATLRDDLDRLCSDLHCMSHNLHSFKLQHLGLKSALRELCSKYSQYDLNVDLDADGSNDPQSEDISLCLYRVAQEALNNCSKHAHALNATVTLKQLHGIFYMTVRDTGIGFDIHANWEGLGLVSMRERLNLVDGRLDIQSTLGHGTEIVVLIPERRDAFTDIDPAKLIAMLNSENVNTNKGMTFATKKKIKGTGCSTVIPIRNAT